MMRIRILVILIVLYFVYMIIGAAVFMTMERQAEKDRCDEAKAAKAIWLKKTEEKEGFSEEMLNGFIKNVTKFAGFGISLQGEVKCPVNWDFQSSLFFTGTIITTIGYGNLAPSQWYSQIFCIVYALFGIPLFAIMFSGIGQYLSLLVDRLLKKFRHDTKSEEETEVVQAVFSFFFICGGSLIIFQLIPAIIFTFVEGWTYRESFYYCFITLTTIGFGDFVAGTNPEIKYIALYRIMVLFWILFGLAYTFTAIDLIINSIRKNFLKSKVADWLIDNWRAADDEVHSELESLFGAGSSGGPEETDRIGPGERRPLLGLDEEGRHVDSMTFGTSLEHADHPSGENEGGTAAETASRSVAASDSDMDLHANADSGETSASTSHTGSERVVNSPSSGSVSAAADRSAANTNLDVENTNDTTTGTLPPNSGN